MATKASHSQRIRRARLAYKNSGALDNHAWSMNMSQWIPFFNVRNMRYLQSLIVMSAAWFFTSMAAAAGELSSG